MRIFIACVALLGIFATTAFGAAGGRECTKECGKVTGAVCNCPDCPMAPGVSKKQYRWYECKDTKEPGDCKNDQKVLMYQVIYFEKIGQHSCDDIIMRVCDTTSGCRGNPVPAEKPGVVLIIYDH